MRSWGSASRCFGVSEPGRSGERGLAAESGWVGRVDRMGCAHRAGAALAWLWPLLLLTLFRTALAGVNDHGYLLLHADPTIAYTVTSNDFCGRCTATSVKDLITEVPLANYRPYLVWVLAAFPDSAPGRIRGLSFGIDYNSAGVILQAHGSCGDQEVVSAGWPGPDSGTSVVWNQPRSGHLIPAYWFAAYSYGRIPMTLALTTRPGEENGFMDDSPSPVSTPVAGFGALGFGLAGRNPAIPSGTGVAAPSDSLSRTAPPAGNSSPASGKVR